MAQLSKTALIAVVALLMTGGTWIMCPGRGAHIPAGNVWTIVGFASVTSGTSVRAVDGAVGDIIVVWMKWNGSTGPPVLTGLTGDQSGAFTLRGTQATHGSVDLCARFGTVVAASTSGDNVTPTFTGTATFIDICIWRLSASGAKDYSVVANGTGTSAAAATSSYTTLTKNGIVITGLGLYDQPTISAQTIGGNTPNNTRSIAGWLQAWDYKNTVQLTGATSNCNFSSGSTRWVIQSLSLSAQ